MYNSYYSRIYRKMNLLMNTKTAYARTKSVACLPLRMKSVYRIYKTVISLIVIMLKRTEVSPMNKNFVS